MVLFVGQYTSSLSSPVMPSISGSILFRKWSSFSNILPTCDTCSITGHQAKLWLPLQIIQEDGMAAVPFKKIASGRYHHLPGQRGIWWRSSSICWHMSPGPVWVAGHPPSANQPGDSLPASQCCLWHSTIQRLKPWRSPQWQTVQELEQAAHAHTLSPYTPYRCPFPCQTHPVKVWHFQPVVSALVSEMSPLLFPSSHGTQCCSCWGLGRPWKASKTHGSAGSHSTPNLTFWTFKYSRQQIQWQWAASSFYWRHNPTCANLTIMTQPLPTLLIMTHLCQLYQSWRNPNSAKFCIVSICSKCSYYLDSLLAEARALSLLGPDCSSWDREEL